jgi:hypothetical protein
MCGKIGEIFRPLCYRDVSFVRFKTRGYYTEKARSYAALMASFGLGARRSCGQTLCQAQLKTAR